MYPATLEQLREFFKDDRFATEAGCKIDSMDDDSVTCSLEIQPFHRNAAGGVMGGAIFTLADLAFAVHSNRDYAINMTENLTLTLSSSINYLKPVISTTIYAKSSIINKGRNIGVFDIKVYDDKGRDIALITTTGYTKGNDYS
jgi:acyl-CoA thioesterase